MRKACLTNAQPPNLFLDELPMAQAEGLTIAQVREIVQRLINERHVGEHSLRVNINPRGGHPTGQGGRR